MKTNPVSIEFTEYMHGFYSARTSPVENVEAYQKSYQDGINTGQKLSFVLTIKIADIDRFLQDPNLEAEAIGHVNFDGFGENLAVSEGRFNLFVSPAWSADQDVVKEMHYRLIFSDKSGRVMTFFGFKTIRKHKIGDLWAETTTLYTRVFLGKHLQIPKSHEDILVCGILRLTPEDFATQMASLKAHGANPLAQVVAKVRFAEAFAAELWEAYKPSICSSDFDQVKRPIPVNTLDGVRGAECRVYHIGSADGLGLTLTRFYRKAAQNPTLLIHGLTSSSDMFIMPEHENLVQYLLDHGSDDVWCLDWRGSRRFTYNLEQHRYTIDDVALFDMPPAIEFIRKEIGTDKKIDVIAHCVGSIAFMMSLAAGRLQGIGRVIANSVSLSPAVSNWSHFKLKVAPFLVDYVLRLPYVSPAMATAPLWTRGALLARLVSLFHRECDVKPCHMVSFMWGSGHPAAYLHQNLNVLTHERLADLFGGTSVHYYRHIRKMVEARAAVPYRPRNGENLPNNYLKAFAENCQTPVLLVSGKENRIFPSSNRLSYELIKKINSEANVNYLEIEGYGHQDIFMGRRAAEDIFPQFVKFLSRIRGVKAA